MALLIVLIAVAWQPSQVPIAAIQPSEPTVRPAGQPAAEPPTENVLRSTPNYAGIPLEDKSVVFLLDRGGSAREHLSEIISSALAASETLTSQRRFAILFWDNNSNAADFPTNGLVQATPENINAARRFADDIFAAGQSTAPAAFARALQRSPSAVVIVTAKGFDLDESWVQAMLAARGTSAVRVHMVSIGATSRNEPAATLAERTGGVFKPVTPAELRQFAR